MEQAARNFVLKYQSTALLQSLNFSDRARSALQRYGFAPDFFTTFSIHHAASMDEKHNAPSVSDNAQKALDTYMNSDLSLSHVSGTAISRLSHVSKFNVRLMSTSGRICLRIADSTRTNDTFVRINERDFGEIEELFQIECEDLFLLVLKKFEKIRVTKDDGDTILMPRNTYPFVRTTEYSVHKIDREIFIQKGSYCLLEYYGDSNAYECVTFRPNDWFSF